MKFLTTYLPILILLSFGATQSHPKNLFSIKLYESFFPGGLADVLIEGSRNASVNDEERYKSFFIQRQNSSDRYLCAIPPQHLEKYYQLQEQEDTSSSVPDLQILDQALSIINQSFSKDKCLFAYELRGLYWTYAFCYADKIIQYREAAHPHVRDKEHKADYPNTVYVLGRFTSATPYKDIKIANQATDLHRARYNSGKATHYSLSDDKESPFSHHSAQKVVLQIVEDGSKCELKMLPRTVEVIYKCDPELAGLTSPQIMDVPEITTCQYKMFIHVPGLCDLEPFAPLRNLEEYSTQVDCQLVEESAVGIEGGKFDDWVSNIKLRDDERFPVRENNRIFIGDHHLMPLGNGFYFALSKTRYESLSPYFNMRNVLVYNGPDDDRETLSNNLGRTLYDAIGKKINAPYFEENQHQLLNWNDSFVMWLELYDHKGDFHTLYKVQRDGERDDMVLSMQVIDPASLLDVEDDEPLDLAFDQSGYEAPHEMWNFQSFRRSGTPQADFAIDEKRAANTEAYKTVTKSTTVTVTQNAEETTVNQRSQEQEKEKTIEDLDYPVSLDDLHLNTDELKKLSDLTGGEPILVEVERDGNVQTVVLDLHEYAPQETEPDI